MLAVTHMKPGSVIINHASALGLGYVPVERTQIVHSAAAMGLIAASRAFSVILSPPETMAEKTVYTIDNNI